MNIEWKNLSDSTLFCTNVGLTERYQMRLADIENISEEHACDIGTFGDGDWWLVPFYADAHNGLLKDRVGPFSTIELAKAAAEMLLLDHVQLFEDDDYV